MNLENPKGQIPTKRTNKSKYIVKENTNKPRSWNHWVESFAFFHPDEFHQFFTKIFDPPPPFVIIFTK